MIAVLIRKIKFYKISMLKIYWMDSELKWDNSVFSGVPIFKMFIGEPFYMSNIVLKYFGSFQL